MKGKLILLITAIIVIGLTIALYSTIVTEWTSLIQMSLGVVCVSEFVIIATMGLLPGLNFKNGSTGIMVDIYAGLMIVWSIIGCNFHGNLYYIGLLLISVVMLVLIGLSVAGSHGSDRLNEEVEQTIDNKRAFATSRASSMPNISSASYKAPRYNLNTMWLVIQSTVYDYDTKRQLRILIERIQALPANCFPNAIIETNMAKITDMCQSLSETQDTKDAHEDILNQINNKVKELTNYIKNI